MNLGEFEASLVYRVSSKTARVTQKIVSNNKNHVIKRVERFATEYCNLDVT